MSPVPPPPAGTIVPTDDWTDDASFDFDASPTKPRAAPSSSKRASMNASPVRNDDDDEAGDMDFDFDESKDGTDSFPAFPSSSSSSTSFASHPAVSATGTMKHVSSTVMGAGPNGIGTITKLSSAPKPAVLSNKGSLRLKKAAVAKAWEDDMDFDMDNDEGDWRAKLTKPPILASKQGQGDAGLTIRRKEMPGPDALDDLDFNINDEEEGEDKEATLKASATLKAMLPPPRPRSLAPTPSKKDEPEKEKKEEEDEDDADFEIPLTLHNLSLATRSPAPTSKQPRSSIVSVSTDWDSPGNSTSTSSKKAEFWGGTPPAKRFSETSGTSISEAFASAHKKRPSHQEGEEEEEDMEDGLVLPSKTFFTTTSKRELDHLLDRKRKPQHGSPSSHSRTDHQHTRPSVVDEGVEDGLVFEDSGKELTMNRLTMGKRDRARSQIPVAIKKQPHPHPGSVTRLVPKHRAHPSESTAPRHTSHDIRERAHSTLGLAAGGYRSHSAGNATPAIKPFSPTRPTSPPNTLHRTRSGQLLSNIASSSSGPAGSAPPPTTPSRLRHQKSHHALSSPSPTPGGTLSRKQSLSALQERADAAAAAGSGPSTLQTLHEDDPRTRSPERYHSSTSRLTMPTSSSRAKYRAPARPPISNIFPMTPSSSTTAAAAPLSTRSKLRQGPANLMRMAKQAHWGDGTELEGIEDLDVGDQDDKEKKSSLPRSIRSKLRKPASPEKKPPSRPGSGFRDTAQKDKDGSTGSRRKKRPPLLIKHLGTVDKKKVVGEMTWNPSKLRWEGNETALRDFDNIPISTSARPALITHISAPNPLSPTSSSSFAAASASASGAGAAAVNTGGSRIVGDMRFDPKEMRWISLSPDEEPDPFADMADDEDDFAGGAGGGTIRASGAAAAAAMLGGRKLVAVGLSEASESIFSSSTGTGTGAGTDRQVSTALTQDLDHDHDHHPHPHAHAHGDTGLVTDALRAECKEAEERHRRDMRGWISGSSSWSRTEARREEKRLWDIRYLALKS